MKEKQFYTVKEIMEKTGYCQSRCYSLIKTINDNLKLKYPNMVIFKGRILAEVWDSQFKQEAGGENEI